MSVKNSLSMVAEAGPAVAPVPTGMRYVQLALIVLAAGAIYPLLYLRQTFQTTMLEILHISNTELGYLYSILGTTFLLSYLPSGWLADRVAPRILIFISLVATGVLGLWYSTLPSFSSLLVIFVGFGITTGLTFWAAVIKRVNMIAGADEQGRFFGILDGGRGLVEALLATAAVLVFAHATQAGAEFVGMGFQRVVYMYSFVCIVLGFLLLLTKDQASTAKVADAGQPRAEFWSDVKALIRIPELWLVAAIVFCGYHLFWSTYSFSAYLQEGGFNLSATVTAFIITVKLWMRPIGGIGGGYLGDRISRTLILAICLLLGGLGMIGLVVFPSLHAVGVLIFLVVFVGLVSYAIRGLYWSVLADCRIPTRITGLAIGVISVIGYSPDALIPLINGYITDQFPGMDGYRIYFTYIAVMSFLGAVAALKLGQMTKNRRSAS